jgi:hypothetical protein
MSMVELKKAYSEMSEKERIVFAAFVAAERLANDPEFSHQLSRRHEAMDHGKKWEHADLLELHERLDKQGL